MKHLSKPYKTLISIFLLVSTFFMSYGNMAKPYVDGTESSTLFGSRNCKVISERIDLTAIGPVNEDDYTYQINYKISYRISSPQLGMLPLLFVARNMSTQPSAVFVNGKKIMLKKLNKQTVLQFKFLKPNESGGDFYDIKFDKNNVEWGISLSDLIYFEADLVKGENVITVSYEGTAEYNVYGLLREYKIKYALYPSNYWKSFGPIEINIKLPKETAIRNVNIGTLQDLENVNYQLVIKKITQDNLQINFAHSVSIFGKILLFLQPIGLAFIMFLIAVFFHYKWINRRRKQNPLRYNYAVPIGALLTTMLFYGVFVFSSDLILWVVNDKGLKQGYFILFVFTSPFFLLIYWLIMWLVDFVLKKRIEPLKSAIEIQQE